MAEAVYFYRDPAYVFVAAVLGGLVASRLRQALILGYVLAGVLIGPFTPGSTISDIRALELLAEIGVILLMYSAGMEFCVRQLLQVKWVAILGGRPALCFPLRSARARDGSSAGKPCKA